MDPINGIFRGVLTDFYVVARALTNQEMQQFTNDCKNPQEIFKNVTFDMLINWKEIDILIEGNNTVSVYLSSDEVCRDKKEETVKIIPIKQNYSNSKQTCEQVGGSLYYVRNTDDVEKLASNLLKGNQFGANVSGDIDVCGSTFWLPIRQNGTKDTVTVEYIWYQEVEKIVQRVDYLPWLFGQPNGGNKTAIVVSKIAL